MCGRYYVDDDTAREIEKLVRQVDEKLYKTSGRRDIHPSEQAAVITGEGDALTASLKKWGFPGFQGKNLIFNARAETVAEKKMFRDSVMRRRCVIPAAGFYEWNRAKEKISFTKLDSPVMYMAGIYKRYEDGDRFVILTTAANDSLSGVHERMPLILETGELTDWIREEKDITSLLKKEPGKLKKMAEYEQGRLFS